MDGSNSQQSNNQNKQGTNQPKSGLSWTQPASAATDSTQINQNKGTIKPTTLTSTPPADSTGRVMSIVVGIIVVFALAAWGIVALNKHSASNGVSTASTTSETTSDTTNPAGTTTPTPASEIAQAPVKTAAVGSASFTVPPTQNAGSSVLVENMTISQPTWIIVYESTNGTPGNILGASLFFTGDTSGMVQLLRATTPGQRYFVSAAIDNGDKSFAKYDERYVLDQSGSQMLVKLQTN